MHRIAHLLGIVIGAMVVVSAVAQPLDLLERVEHGYADNEGVKIHYVTLGEGPLVVMLHGFPDFWYTWRDQMDALSSQFQVAAIDLRGYNRSDRPEGVQNYTFGLLMKDVIAVIEDLGQEKAIVVGNDWGGAISWYLAMYYPDRVEKLIICNLPHPNGMTRELAGNPEQQRNSEYARRFQEEDAHETLTVEGLTTIVAGNRDEAVQEQYRAAFARSDFEAMLNYYKASFPKQSTSSSTASSASATTATSSLPSLPLVKSPVLVIHGLEDTALLAAGLNDTWEWIDNELTIMTIPGAGHFVQQDAPDRVTRAMLAWLNR